MTNTYEDLCMSVQRIADAYGLETEVHPMKNYLIKDTDLNKFYVKSIKIIFVNKLSLMQPELSLRRYTYFLSPYDWKKIQTSKEDYDIFIKFLIARVKENIIH